MKDLDVAVKKELRRAVAQLAGTDLSQLTAEGLRELGDAQHKVAMRKSMLREKQPRLLPKMNAQDG
jgi:hypothetical protein